MMSLWKFALSYLSIIYTHSKYCIKIGHFQNVNKSYVRIPAAPLWCLSKRSEDDFKWGISPLFRTTNIGKLIPHFVTNIIGNRSFLVHHGLLTH